MWIQLMVSALLDVYMHCLELENIIRRRQSEQTISQKCISNLHIVY